MKKSLIAGTAFGIIAMAFAGLFYFIAAGNPYYILVPATFASAFIAGFTAWLFFRGDGSSSRALAAGMVTGAVLVPLAWFLAVFWKYVLTGPTTSTELNFMQAVQGAFSIGISSSLKLIWYTIPVGAISGYFIRLRFFPMMP